MSNLKNVLKNGIFSLTYQIITIILSLITRNCFLKYVGIELLGINSTFSSILSTLSLAELGFETAITFHLYKPIEQNNRELINKIINIYKKVYHNIAFIIIITSFLILPFLHNFLKGIEVTSYIYFVFILQALNTSFSYFLSYKRTLLFADKKDYVCKSVDIVANVLFSILKIITLAIYKKYELYLIVTILQTIVSNIIIHIICRKLYPYLHNEKIEKRLLKNIFKDVKNVFAAKISNYIYSSTDNIIISSMIGSSFVGLVVNYTTITIQLKMLITLIMNPVIPIIGRSLVNINNDCYKKIEQFNFITFFRFCMILSLVVPAYILLEDFIIMWIGKEYVLPKVILILLIYDLYISIIYAPCFDYLNAAGLFKQEKYVMIIASIMNIISSILLTYIIGFPGVFVGTIITQIFLWISRSCILFLQYFKENTMLKKYWKKQIYYFLVFVLTIILCTFIKDLIIIENVILDFIISGICCEMLIVIIFVISLWRFEESKHLFTLIKRLIVK